MGQYRSKRQDNNPNLPESLIISKAMRGKTRTESLGPIELRNTAPLPSPVPSRWLIGNCTAIIAPLRQLFRFDSDGSDILIVTSHTKPIEVAPASPR